MTEAVRVDVDVRVADAAHSVVNDAFVGRILSAAAEQIAVHGEVSVSFVTDEEIHDLNRTWRNVDRSTDVLSFPMEEEEDDVASDAAPRLLGDIVISLPTARRQADEYGHSLEREVGFLLVHGFLHLNGYDHETPADEQRMFSLQDEVLDSVGLPR